MYTTDLNGQQIQSQVAKIPDIKFTQQQPQQQQQQQHRPLQQPQKQQQQQNHPLTQQQTTTIVEPEVKQHDINTVVVHYTSHIPTVPPVPGSGSNCIEIAPCFPSDDLEGEKPGSTPPTKPPFVIPTKLPSDAVPTETTEYQIQKLLSQPLPPPPPHTPPPPHCMVHIPVKVGMNGILGAEMSSCEKGCEFGSKIASIGSLSLVPLRGGNDTAYGGEEELVGSKRWKVDRPLVMQVTTDDVETRRQVRDQMRRYAQFFDRFYDFEKLVFKGGGNESESGEAKQNVRGPQVERKMMLVQRMRIPHHLVPDEVQKRAVLITLPKGKALLKCLKRNKSIIADKNATATTVDAINADNFDPKTEIFDGKSEGKSNDFLSEGSAGGRTTESGIDTIGIVSDQAPKRNLLPRYESPSNRTYTNDHHGNSIHDNVTDNYAGDRREKLRDRPRMKEAMKKIAMDVIVSLYQSAVNTSHGGARSRGMSRGMSRDSVGDDVTGGVDDVTGQVEESVSHNSIDIMKLRMFKAEQKLQHGGQTYTQLNGMGRNLQKRSTLHAGGENMQARPIKKKEVKLGDVTFRVRSKREEEAPKTIVELYGKLPRVPLKITLTPKGPLEKLNKSVQIEVKPPGKMELPSMIVAKTNDSSVGVHILNDLFVEPKVDEEEEVRMQKVYSDFKRANVEHVVESKARELDTNEHFDVFENSKNQAVWVTTKTAIFNDDKSEISTTDHLRSRRDRGSQGSSNPSKTIIEMFGNLPRVPLKIVLKPRGALAKLSRAVQIELRPPVESDPESRGFIRTNDSSVDLRITGKLFKPSKTELALEKVYSEVKSHIPALKGDIKSRIPTPSLVVHQIRKAATHNVEEMKRVMVNHRNGLNRELINPPRLVEKPGVSQNVQTVNANIRTDILLNPSPSFINGIDDQIELRGRTPGNRFRSSITASQDTKMPGTQHAIHPKSSILTKQIYPKSAMTNDAHLRRAISAKNVHAKSLYEMSISIREDRGTVRNIKVEKQQVVKSNKKSEFNDPYAELGTMLGGSEIYESSSNIVDSANDTRAVNNTKAVSDGEHDISISDNRTLQNQRATDVLLQSNKTMMVQTNASGEDRMSNAMPPMNQTMKRETTSNITIEENNNSTSSLNNEEMKKTNPNDSRYNDTIQHTAATSSFNKTLKREKTGNARNSTVGTLQHEPVDNSTPSVDDIMTVLRNRYNYHHKNTTKKSDATVNQKFKKKNRRKEKGFANTVGDMQNVGNIVEEEDLRENATSSSFDGAAANVTSIDFEQTAIFQNKTNFIEENTKSNGYADRNIIKQKDEMENISTQAKGFSVVNVTKDEGKKDNKGFMEEFTNMMDTLSNIKPAKGKKVFLLNHFKFLAPSNDSERTTTGGTNNSVASLKMGIEKKDTSIVANNTHTNDSEDSEMKVNATGLEHGNNSRTNGNNTEVSNTEVNGLINSTNISVADSSTENGKVKDGHLKNLLETSSEKKSIKEDPYADLGSPVKRTDLHETHGKKIVTTSDDSITGAKRDGHTKGERKNHHKRVRNSKRIPSIDSAESVTKSHPLSSEPINIKTTLKNVNSSLTMKRDKTVTIDIVGKYDPSTTPDGGSTEEGDIIGNMIQHSTNKDFDNVTIRANLNKMDTDDIIKILNKKLTDSKDAKPPTAPSEYEFLPASKPKGGGAGGGGAADPVKMQAEMMSLGNNILQLTSMFKEFKAKTDEKNKVEVVASNSAKNSINNNDNVNNNDKNSVTEALNQSLMDRVKGYQQLLDQLDTERWIKLADKSQQEKKLPLNTETQKPQVSIESQKPELNAEITSLGEHITQLSDLFESFKKEHKKSPEPNDEAKPDATKTDVSKLEPSDYMKILGIIKAKGKEEVPAGDNSTSSEAIGAVPIQRSTDPYASMGASEKKHVLGSTNQSNAMVSKKKNALGKTNDKQSNAMVTKNNKSGNDNDEMSPIFLYRSVIRNKTDNLSELTHRNRHSGAVEERGDTRDNILGIKRFPWTDPASSKLLAMFQDISQNVRKAGEVQKLQNLEFKCFSINSDDLLQLTNNTNKSNRSGDAENIWEDPYLMNGKEPTLIKLCRKSSTVNGKPPTMSPNVAAAAAVAEDVPPSTTRITTKTMEEQPAAPAAPPGLASPVPLDAAADQLPPPSPSPPSLPSPPPSPSLPSPPPSPLPASPPASAPAQPPAQSPSPSSLVHARIWPSDASELAKDILASRFPSDAEEDIEKALLRAYVAIHQENQHVQYNHNNQHENESKMNETVLVARDATHEVTSKKKDESRDPYAELGTDVSSID